MSSRGDSGLGLGPGPGSDCSLQRGDECSYVVFPGDEESIDSPYSFFGSFGSRQGSVASSHQGSVSSGSGLGNRSVKVINSAILAAMAAAEQTEDEKTTEGSRRGQLSPSNGADNADGTQEESKKNQQRK